MIVTPVKPASAALAGAYSDGSLDTTAFMAAVNHVSALRAELF